MIFTALAFGYGFHYPRPLPLLQSLSLVFCLSPSLAAAAPSWTLSSPIPNCRQRRPSVAAFQMPPLPQRRTGSLGPHGRALEPQKSCRHRSHCRAPRDSGRPASRAGEKQYGSGKNLERYSPSSWRRRPVGGDNFQRDHCGLGETRRGRIFRSGRAVVGKTRSAAGFVGNVSRVGIVVGSPAIVAGGGGFRGSRYYDVDG